MKPKTSLSLTLRRQTLETDADGFATWRVHEEERRIAGERVALLLCDVWDEHWCRGANVRLAAMLPRMNAVATAARAAGVHVIHAPSDTMDFYADHPARKRMQAFPRVEPPPPLDLYDPPLPIDDSDGGCDTGEPPWRKAWSRQHPAIAMDGDRDAISEDGAEIYGFLRTKSVEILLVMGVHANMCVLHRSFGIKAMTRWGVSVALVRDLTDTMYHPARRPYVYHAEGTRLVVDYIEKFWCPTVHSDALLR